MQWTLCYEHVTLQMWSGRWHLMSTLCVCVCVCVCETEREREREREREGGERPILIADEILFKCA